MGCENVQVVSCWRRRKENLREKRRCCKVLNVERPPSPISSRCFPLLTKTKFLLLVSWLSNPPQKKPRSPNLSTPFYSDLRTKKILHPLVVVVVISPSPFSSSCVLFHPHFLLLLFVLAIRSEKMLKILPCSRGGRSFLLFPNHCIQYCTYTRVWLLTSTKQFAAFGVMNHSRSLSIYILISLRNENREKENLLKQRRKRKASKETPVLGTDPKMKIAFKDF